MQQGRENTPHIGLFGRVNAGKSTLMNFITGAPTAIVSPQGGTTTDPVRKSYEILGFSPVVLVDTAGVDDPSLLGAERMARTAEAARAVDLAVLVFREWGAPEEELVATFTRLGVPYILVHNVSGPDETRADLSINLLSPAPGDHAALLDLFKGRLPAASRTTVRMFGGLLTVGDHVILVCPIDGGAPAGRMILPQVQALREVLDAGAVAHVVQPGQLSDALAACPGPRMVVTDSQVYGLVRDTVPAPVEVTTFSILLAAAKGDYDLYLRGLEAVDTLRPGERVLVCEFCSHQTSCDDIARVKLPAWLSRHAGGELQFVYVGPGEALPSDLGSYALMLLCGGCMATPTRIRRRIEQAREAGLPATNFGMLIRRLQSKKCRPALG